MKNILYIGSAIVLIMSMLFATDNNEQTVPTTTTSSTTTSTTSTTSTTTTTVPVTTTTIKPGKCGEWYSLAMEIGWPEEEWETLSKVMYRESRCQPDAWNGHDAGLMQINQIHKVWLSDFGWTHPDSMFDPRNNLTFALYLWRASGWSPWRFSGFVPGD